MESVTIWSFRCTGSILPNDENRFFGFAPDNSVHIYMDDLIVVGCSEKHRLSNLQKVFEKCKLHNLKLNPQKCEFFRTGVKLLGHLCTQIGFLPDPEKIIAVEKYPKPTDKD